MMSPSRETYTMSWASICSGSQKFLIRRDFRQDSKITGGFCRRQADTSGNRGYFLDRDNDSTLQALLRHDGSCNWPLTAIKECRTLDEDEFGTMT